jgi:muramoyltetrapeptide carboxypeptidase
MQGFEVEMPLDPSKHFGSKVYLFSSDSVANRLKALYSLYKSKKIDAILTVRGAYGSMELLEAIKFASLKGASKPLIGLSDTTALLCALHRYAQVPLIHGPVVESLSRIGTETEAELNGLKLVSFLKGTNLQPFTGVELSRVSGSRSAKGTLLAGNISMFSALCGTKFAPKTAGCILCLEEVRESPYRVHRMLLQMKLAGLFSKVSAVVFGSLRNCVHPKGLGPGIEDVLTDIFNGARFPVYQGLPFGHEGANFPIPFGIRAQLVDNQLELSESSVLE